MTIKELAEQSGFSDHTLRYYEKIGLLKNIVRNRSGYRDYDPSDVEWLAFLRRLKDTGMPLKEMIIFSELRYKGQSTAGKRLALLERHRAKIEGDIALLKENLQVISEKIVIYKKM